MMNRRDRIGRASFYVVSLMAALGSACQVTVSSGGGEGGVDATGDRSSGGRTPNAGEKSMGGALTALGGSGAASSRGGAAPGSAGTQEGTSSAQPGHFEDCGVAETVANDDREHARALGTEARFCVDENGDHDWFYVAAPDDGKAHVIQLDFAQAAEAWLQGEIYAERDFSKMGGFSLERGVKDTLYVTVGPGTRTLFDFSRYIQSEGPITVRTKVTAEQDSHEANNQREDAVRIQPSTAISGQMMVPYVSEDLQSPSDWFVLDLEAGEHTIKVSAVPSDVWLGLEIFDGEGVSVRRLTAPNEGAIFEDTIELERAGTYYLGWYPYVSQLSVVTLGTIPDHLTQPYTFRID